MLADYIHDYVDAYLKQDKREMRQIEGTLVRLGMDRATLIYLVKAELAERKREDSK